MRTQGANGGTFRIGALLAGALVAVLVSAANASTGEPPVQRIFEHAETIKTGRRVQFLHALNQLHSMVHELSPAQRLHLHYLDAWNEAYAGHLAKAETLLHEVIDQSNDATIRTRANALLINIFSRSGRYEEAYALANKLMARLNSISDLKARQEATRNIVQMLGLAGQRDEALKYIHLLEADAEASGDQCSAQSYKLNAEATANKLSPSDPELHRAIRMCLEAGQTVYANTLRLNRAYILMDEGHERAAIALLQRIAPSVRKSEFEPHAAELHLILAEAHLKLGETSQARASALAALKARVSGGYSWVRQNAYHVLYEVAEKNGDPNAALAYYKQFSAQKIAAANGAKARALAYQMVKQEVLAKHLKVEALSRQNRILQLQQQLDHKAAETGRLYVMLLLCGLALAGVWLYRLFVSHRNLKHVARHDGLTGVLNHQNFFDEAGRLLTMNRAAGAATTMVLIDLDHFKQVNDRHGHATGDAVLRLTARTCRQQLRDEDILGRLGGEEFGVLIGACSAEAAAEITQRIRQAIAACRTTLANGTVIGVTASFGLAHSEDSSASLQQLYANADTALYRAKHGGRNQLVVSGEDAEGSTATVSGSLV